MTESVNLTTKLLPEDKKALEIFIRHQTRYKSASEFIRDLIGRELNEHGYEWVGNEGFESWGGSRRKKAQQAEVS